MLQAPPIDSTVTRKEAAPFLQRAGMGIVGAIVCFILGAGMLIIPIIGWILGPIMMIGSIGIFGNSFSAQPTYTGKCPYCGRTVLAGNPEDVRKCISCKNRFVHRAGQLWKIEK